MARLPSYITRIDGSRGPRYEARINATLSTGKRLQHRKRFRSFDEAKAWHAKTLTELESGTHTPPSDLTVHEAVEAWLTAKAARTKPSTAAAYKFSLAPVVAAYGNTKVQKLSKADVERLVTDLRTGAGDRGLWRRTSINPMLARWRKVWADLHAEGVVARNVVALVEPLRKPSGEPAMKVDDSLSEAEVELLIKAHSDGANGYARRREPFVHLALLGLRRGELSGLRWSAVVLEGGAPSIAVAATRVTVTGKVIEQDDAKTASSSRTLPIPPHLLPILRRAHAEMHANRGRLGERWEGGDDPYVFALDLGAPLSPRTLNAWWKKSLEDANLPHRRLHASRHTAASLLALRGAPVPMIAAWLGHADGGVLAMRTYVHTPGAALTDTAALLSHET
ncbi:site-specific integrase [Tsukamurella sp. M9C]|uniref:site-specific integrase n=1 Tax=unclassified Tsukamurella TaxID=2633480 RepID=UPI001CCBF508|nr:site-specific integrase [Tsukamurella sp. M9C]MCA0155528.1 site-specific integrase [Tsukamurella sp. M9C]